MKIQQKRGKMMQVLKLQLQRDQSALASIDAKIAELQLSFEDVGRVSWSTQDIGNDLTLIAHSENTDAWIEQTRRLISIETSAEYAKRGPAKEAVQASFGRLEAFKMLTKKQQKVEQQQKSRRQVS